MRILHLSMGPCLNFAQGRPGFGLGSPQIQGILTPTFKVSLHSGASHYCLGRFDPRPVDLCAEKAFSDKRNKSSAAIRTAHFPPAHGFKLSNRGSESRKVRDSLSRAAEAIDEETKEKKEEQSNPRRPTFRCLTQISTKYNQIVILEAPETSSSQYAGSRVLLLDHSGNVHSIYKLDSAWTNSYWDEFATLPAIIPPGPVAIFGLGGGTAARLLLNLWPSLRVEGFEIDEILVEQARLLLGLSELEVPTSEGGCLTVHVDDAFSPSATIDGGFSGIIVDLFSEGAVVAELQQPQTWLNLQKRLRPGGRIMVNCGGILIEKGDPKTNLEDGTWTWEDGEATKDATLLAMASAFQGQLNVRKMDSEANCFALSGPLPDLESWAAAVPERLKEGVSYWRLYT